MIQSDAPYKVPLEADELAYLVKKKEEGFVTFRKGLVIMGVLIVAVGVLLGLVVYVIVKAAPDTFFNTGETINVWLISLRVMGILLWVVVIANLYSYFRGLNKVVQDVKEGKKTIEPCRVMRKIQVDSVYHVYITSTLKGGVDVTEDEYLMLQEGDKISVEYSPRSLVYFGYFI